MKGADPIAPVAFHLIFGPSLEQFVQHQMELQLTLV